LCEANEARESGNECNGELHLCLVGWFSVFVFGAFCSFGFVSFSEPTRQARAAMNDAVANFTFIC
jgi:hypothetical protein